MTVAIARSVVPPRDPIDHLNAEGYAVVSLSGDQASDLLALERILAPVGNPLHVFTRQPFWKPLGVDLTRPLERSGGIGLNTLHIDCVNAELPPDIVCLYCVRPDPAGGGANIIAVVDGIEQDLSRESRFILSQPQFREGAVVDLRGVGDDINPFAVLNLDGSGWSYRYTARLLNVADRASRIEALHELNAALWHRVELVMLDRGDALIVDQRRVVHGRLPLQRGQDRIPTNDRRLIVQAYWRRSGDRAG